MSDLKALAYACGGIFDNRNNSAAVRADAYRKLLRAIELHDCDRDPDALTEQLKAALSRAVAAETALAAAQAQAKELRAALTNFMVPFEGDAPQIAAPLLAAPSDATALRALLLRAGEHCMRAGYGLGRDNHQTDDLAKRTATIVDAVLAKEGM